MSWMKLEVRLETGGSVKLSPSLYAGMEQGSKSSFALVVA
jgi:hypothetical protein